MKYLISFLILLIGAVAYGCEPCALTLSLEESAQQADLILIGRKIAAGPAADPTIGGPDWIEVEVQQVFKGVAPGKSVKVNSWDAMCDYGIVVQDDKNYLMLLKQKTNLEEGYAFDTVNYGCAAKAYPVEDNLVNLEGKKISLEEFQNRLNLKL